MKYLRQLETSSLRIRVGGINCTVLPEDKRWKRDR